MWRASKITAEQADATRAAREELAIGPLVIHTSYLVNLCSQSEEICEKSVQAFRGEIERALALGAEYLVVHPGSYRGMTRQQGLELAAKSIQKAIAGLPWQQTPISYPDRKYRRLGAFAGRLIRAGCGTDRASSPARSRWPPAWIPATPTSPVMTLSARPDGSKPWRRLRRPLASRPCVSGTATMPRRSADRSSTGTSISGKGRLGWIRFAVFARAKIFPRRLHRRNPGRCPRR